MLNLANRTLDAWDRSRGKPSFAIGAEEAIGLARRETGLSDFGDDIDLSVRAMCDALVRPPGMTPVGRFVRRREILALLRTKLHVTHAIASDLGPSGEVIENPWFVLGLPRSGTTLLHRLIAEDPRHRAPLFWEINAFFPRPASPNDGPDPRLKAAERTIRLMARTAPDFRAIHDVTASSPEECVGILGLGLLANGSVKRAYEIHRQYLRLLQRGSLPRKWVLKAPLHMLNLRSLLEEYRDACIIQMHRDPIHVVPSLASLMAAEARQRHRTVDLAKVGRKAFQTALYMVRTGLDVRDKVEGADPGRKFIDVRYDDLVADPIAAVAGVYRAFESDLSEAARASMARFLSRDHGNRTRRHRYSLDEFGLDADAIRLEFADYIDRFLTPPGKGVL